jgi:D-alanyl-D-alanine carboxypeptidase
MTRKFASVGLVSALLLTFLLGVFVVRAQDEAEILTEILSEYTSDDGPAMAIQVTTPEDSWAASAGRADGVHTATLDDQFRIGSMSKTFVATLALLLVDDGVFFLDDLASDWLPADVVENIANADMVTIRQLLAMRSGIDDYLATDEFWEVVSEDPTHKWTAEEALQYAYGLEPLFAPDEAYSYSNTNYLLIQLVLEKASGKPLHELMRERILEPLNMTHTYTQGFENLDSHTVYGYEDFDGDGTEDEVSSINDGWGLGDGALVSTVSDVSNFYWALLHDQSLLSQEAMNELLDFQDDGEGGTYSLGLGEGESDWGPVIGHSGAVSGFVSDGFYLPDYEALVVIFAASAEISPDEAGWDALDALVGDEEEE